jgi:hypothetical protein
MGDSPVLAVLVGLVVGMLLIGVFAMLFAPDLPNIQIINATSTEIISQSEAETAARNDIDRLYQNNGEEPGFFKGGKLGSADLIYVDRDGTNYLVDKPTGSLGEKLRHSIDGSYPNQYIWQITFNFGDSSKPEYDYAVDATTGKAWMIGVND